MAFGTLVHGADVLLRDWIQKSGLREGDRLPSERALAKLLEVQHYALNRAMARLIAEGVVLREGYKLFCAAKRTTESRFSCHLVIAHRSIYLRSYRKVAKELGIECVVHRYTTLEDAVATLHQLDSSETDGVIFDPPIGYGSPYWEQAMSDLMKHGVPVMCIGNPAKGVPSLLADYPRALDLIFHHLRDLGHRDLALMSIPAWTPTLLEIQETWKNLCHQNGLRPSAKRIHIPNNSIILREDIEEFADRLMGEWDEVTALVVYCETEPTIPQLLEILANRKKHIPKDLSLVCLRDSPPLRTSNPPVTVAESDVSVIQETAFRMVQRMARKRDDPSHAATSCSIRIQPELILRASTAPSRHSSLRHDLHPAKIAPPLLNPNLGKSLAEIEENLESARRQPYPLVARAEGTRFAQINLESLVNRPLNFRRGWLGDLPLKHFDPGEHVIHGVPFHVLGGSHRSDCGAIVFHSTVNTRGNAQELPVQLRIPIKAKATAIYILHGCGYARFLKPFATYGFFQGKKQLDQVSLVPLGQPPADFSINPKSPDFLKANIQDWWPDLPHINFPHARMAPINEGEITDTIHRHVYLYTLEWINPYPEREIDFLKITVDPKQSTTLGLLAISVLKPI